MPSCAPVHPLIMGKRKVEYLGSSAPCQGSQGFPLPALITQATEGGGAEELQREAELRVGRVQSLVLLWQLGS